MTAAAIMRRMLAAAAACAFAVSTAHAQVSLAPPGQQKAQPQGSAPKQPAPSKDSATAAPPAKSASGKTNAKSAPSALSPPLGYTNAPADTLPPDNPNVDLAYGAFQRGEYGDAFKIATQRAEQRGDPKAMTLLGELYANGEGVNRDDQKAVIWYKNAADRGDREVFLSRDPPPSSPMY